MKSFPRIPDPEELPTYFLPPENRGFRQVLTFKSCICKSLFYEWRVFSFWRGWMQLVSNRTEVFQLLYLAFPQKEGIFLDCCLCCKYNSQSQFHGDSFLTVGAGWAHETQTEWGFKHKSECLVNYINKKTTWEREWGEHLFNNYS